LPHSFLKASERGVRRPESSNKPYGGVLDLQCISGLITDRGNNESVCYNAPPSNCCTGIQSVQTTNIDRCYRSTLRVNPFGVRMNTARWAKPMPDYVFVKLISADVFIRRLDRQLLARDEPQ
jgi:hypothetical protein